VSVLVVTWNSQAVLPTLLESLEPDADSLELVHVDNASADQTVALAGAWRGDLVQVTNSENRGYAAALRQAFDAARGEAVLVVNPDVRLEPGALALLRDRLRPDAGVGAVGPKLVGADGSLELFCARRLPTLRAALLQALGLRGLVAGTALDPYTYRRSTYDTEHDVDCLSGAAMLIDREALAACGGVDDRWFMYFEDIDLCARLRQGGWRIRYCPEAVAGHTGAASSPRSTALTTWLAVHLEAAVNLFFRVHRGRAVAFTHRGLLALDGAIRMLAAPAALLSSPAAARSTAARGHGLLRWAFTSRLPRGGPR
jgi:GT2 family glycosyltransferase